MAEYLPPTEDLPIFDSSVFNNANDSTNQGTTGQYIKYPVAQGAVTLLDTTIDGFFKVQNNDNKITMNDPLSNEGLCIGNSASAQNATLQQSTIIGYDTVISSSSKNLLNCVVIGNNAFQNSSTSSTKTEYYNTAIGTNSLNAQVNTDDLTLANSAVGNASLYTLTTGNNNTAIGSQSGIASGATGYDLVVGNNNTFLGAKTGLNPSLLKTCNHSTAIGAESLITDNNQIMLGTSSDYVQIPNYIKFSDGTTQNTAAESNNLGLTNILDFGAIPNDPTFDNTGPINNAINALSYYSTLYIPEGNFYIQSSIIITNKNFINIFSEGSISTGTSISNIELIKITNSSSINFNGHLRLANGLFGTNNTGLSIKKVVSPPSDVTNINITGISFYNLNIGLDIELDNEFEKQFSNLSFDSCTTSINNSSTRSNFLNMQIRLGDYGILNRGLKNTYTNGLIKDAKWGFINVAYDIYQASGIVSNMFFDYCDNTNLIDFGDSLIINSCNFANDSSTPIGNPLNINLVPPAIQTKIIPGIYLQDAIGTNIIGCYIRQDGNPSIMINGCSGITIANNQVNFNTSTPSFIQILGTGNSTQNLNINVDNNSGSAIYPILTYDSSDSDIINTGNMVFNGNVGFKKLLQFNNTGIPATRYIDGSYQFYEIYNNCVDTIYLTNAPTNSQFTINYIRTSDPTFTSSTNLKFSLVIINLSINNTPDICDGLGNGTITISGTTYKTIDFYKPGSYIFQPNILNSAIFYSGAFTIYPTFKDPQLYFSPSLSTSSALDFSSIFYYNTSVNIQPTAGSNNNITLPEPSILNSSSFSYIGSTFRIQNSTTNILTLNRTGSGLIKGIFGNSDTSITLPINSWYLFTFDGTNYLLNDKNPEKTIFNETTSSANVVYNNTKYLNSEIYFSSSTNTTIDIPKPVINTSIKIYNNCQSTANLRSADFYGTATQSGVVLTVISVVGTVAVNSTVVFNGLNLVIQPYGTGGTTGTGGIGTYTVTNFQNVGTATDFYGRIGSSITFGGEWGNSDPSIKLNPNSWSLLYATSSTSWDVIDRSANQIFDDITVSASISYTPHYNFLNSYVPFVPNANTWTVTIPSAIATFSKNKWLKIENNSSTNILTIGSAGGNFTGLFGSGTTSITLPAQTWVNMNSNGTGWVIDDRSQNFNFFLNPSSTAYDFSSNLQYFDSSIEFITSDNVLSDALTSVFTGTIANNTNTLVISAATLSIVPGGSFQVGSGTFYIVEQVYTASINPGGAGSYITTYNNISGATITLTSANMKVPNPGRNYGTVTISQGHYPQANIVSVLGGSGIIDAGARLTVNGLDMFYMDLLERLGSTGGANTGTYYCSSNNRAGTLTTAGFQSISATTVLLPEPSSAKNRKITITNLQQSNVNITTSARSAVFGGVYGQQYITTTITPVITLSKNHLVRTGQTVVLKSDGSIWEAIIGTTLSGSKTIYSGTTSSPASSSASDATYLQVNAKTYNLTSNNLNCLCNNDAGSGSYFFNYYPFPITIAVNGIWEWSIPSVLTVSTKLPTRIVGFQVVRNSKYINPPTSYYGLSSVAPNPSSASTALFQLASSTFTQGSSAIITLGPGDAFCPTTYKVNTGGAETYIFTCQIQRIA